MSPFRSRDFKWLLKGREILVSVLTVCTAIVFLPFGAYRIPFQARPPQTAEVPRYCREWHRFQNPGTLHCSSSREPDRAVQIFPSSVWEMGVSLWHYLPRCPRWHSVLLMENHSSGPGTVRVVHHDSSQRTRKQFKQKVQSTWLWRHNGRETQKGRRIHQKPGKRRRLCRCVIPRDPLLLGLAVRGKNLKHKNNSIWRWFRVNEPGNWAAGI